MVDIAKVLGGVGASGSSDNGCKWCALGECWGCRSTPSAKGQARNSPANRSSPYGGKGAFGMGGGMPFGGMGFMPPMGMMGMMGKGMMGKGDGKGCRWCAIGECWGCKQNPDGGKGAGPLGGQGALMAEQQGVPEATPEEVEAFLQHHSSVNDFTKDRLKSLDPRLQTLVLARGPMEEARDETAMLMGRMRTVSAMKEGDWVCFGCYDHNFSKNETCRKCEAPKPI